MKENSQRNKEQTSVQRSAWSTLAEARLADLKKDASTSVNCQDMRAALQRVDEELAALGCALSSMRNRRNALSAVMRLPPEALSRIFMWLSQLEKPNQNRYQWDARLGWIKITHVCHTWRDVALNNASLWTAIDFNSVPLARAMLERSRDQGLILSEHIDGFPYGQARRASSVEASGLREHASRIRLLDLQSNVDMTNAILTVLSESAPLLESVHIVGSTPSPHSRKDYVDEKDIPFLNSHIFGGETPRLRRLSLQQARISWDSPILLSGLTHFEIRLPANCMTPTDPNGYSMISMTGPPPKRWLPTHDQLLSVLSTMPALATLILERTLPEDDHNTWARHWQSPAIDSASTRLKFPHLRLVELDGPFLACAHFLSCLSVPSDASLLVTTKAATIYGAGRVNTEALAQRMFTAHGHPPIQIHSLRVHVARTFVTLEGWQGPQQVPLREYHTDLLPPPVVKFALRDISQYDVHYDQQKIFTAVLSALPADSVEQLIVSADNYQVTDNTWWSYFGDLREVRTVQATGDCGNSLISALSLSPKPASVPIQRGTGQLLPFAIGNSSAETYTTKMTYEYDPTSNTLLFPALTTIALDEVNFKDPSGIAGRDVTYECLKKVLLLRKKRGVPVKTLLIESCTIDRKWIRELEKMVQEVDWDHCELRREDDPDASESEEDEEDEYGYDYERRMNGFDASDSEEDEEDDYDLYL